MDLNMAIVMVISLTQVLFCVAGAWWFAKYESGNGVRRAVVAVFVAWAWCQLGWLGWRLVHYHAVPVTLDYVARLATFNGPLAVSSVWAGLYFAKLIRKARRGNA